MACASGHGGEERGSRYTQAENESVERASVERGSAGQSGSYTLTDIVFQYRTDGVEPFKGVERLNVAAANVSGLV